MKNPSNLFLILIGIFISFTFLFSSCKKDYNCTCTYKNADTIFPYNKLSKKNAESNCSQTETSLKDSDANTTCTLNIVN